jgi:8-oxo-dGTP pyrophosphatase MutT (NUDIX family)
MDVLNTKRVLQLLHEQLLPVQAAEDLVDAVEGARPDARKAAVLVPFFEQQGELQLVFIRRASTLRAHSGEIAFPGGQVDASDLSLEMTALREAYEEIGLQPERAEVLGVLAPVFTVVSNYLITPVVAFLPQGLGELLLQESEVTEVMIVPLRTLTDPLCAHTEEWTLDGVARTIFFYAYNGSQIWGATGRILSAFLALLRLHDRMTP